jgi:hypothetical protein
MTDQPQLDEQRRTLALRTALDVLEQSGDLGEATRVAQWVLDSLKVLNDTTHTDPIAVAVDPDDLRRLANIRDNWIHNRAGASAVNLALQSVLDKYADQLGEAPSEPTCDLRADETLDRPF